MNGVDLERQNKELRRLLYEQWETNHHEHCGKVGDHADCYWPLPQVLTPPQVDTNH